MSIALPTLVANKGWTRFMLSIIAAFARFSARIDGQSANYQGRQQCQND